MHEINLRNADFNEIVKFAKNLLAIEDRSPQGHAEYVAYISTETQVMLARKVSEGLQKLQLGATTRSLDS